LWHRSEVREALARSEQEPVQQIQPIVKHILRSWLWYGRVYPRDPVSQVTAYMLSELLPEIFWQCGIAMENDGSKQGAKFRPYSHLRGLLQALHPLIVILKESPSKACSLECGTDLAIDSAQVLK
jgi:hypothetical protein